MGSREMLYLDRPFKSWHEAHRGFLVKILDQVLESLKIKQNNPCEAKTYWIILINVIYIIIVYIIYKYYYILYTRNYSYLLVLNNLSRKTITKLSGKL